MVQCMTTAALNICQSYDRGLVPFYVSDFPKGQPGLSELFGCTAVPSRWLSKVKVCVVGGWQLVCAHFYVPSHV